ncbi:hypothetical protein ACI2IY_19295 [Lysobacter enzymogenes]|uniref:hypothetical protein n=1 Tax=Lysobacter enzymogenes TaxID=69 RepID=UPI00384FFD70
MVGDFRRWLTIASPSAAARSIAIWVPLRRPLFQRGATVARDRPNNYSNANRARPLRVRSATCGRIFLRAGAPGKSQLSEVAARSIHLLRRRLNRRCARAIEVAQAVVPSVDIGMPFVALERLSFIRRLLHEKPFAYANHSRNARR